MDCNAARAGDVARDGLGICRIAALGKSDHIIFVVLDAHLARMSDSSARLGGGSFFVGLPSLVGGGLALVGFGLLLRALVNKALVVGGKPGADFLARL